MEPFELFAVKYGHHGPRSPLANAIRGDLHDEATTDLDMYVWVAKRSDRAFLIDTGMNARAAEQRQRTRLRAPDEAIGLLGLDAAQVEDVIITHLHYDHAGTLDRYAAARFHVQDREVAFATGRCMCRRYLRGLYDVEDVVALVRLLHAERVTFHDPVEEIVPGLTVHRIGGHSAGIQAVRVWTKRGWVVLASDAVHFFALIRHGLVFPTLYRADEVLEGYQTILKLAEGDLDRIVPGHDPMVMQMYRSPSPELEGIVVRLDEPPVEHLQ